MFPLQRSGGTLNVPWWDACRAGAGLQLSTSDGKSTTDSIRAIFEYMPSRQTRIGGSVRCAWIAGGVCIASALLSCARRDASVGDATYAPTVESDQITSDLSAFP